MMQMNMLSDLYVGVFAGAGRGCPTGQVLRAEDNAWCVVLDLPHDIQDRTPVLFSRNATFSRPLGEATLNDISGISDEAVPGMRAVVVVYRDGSAPILTKREHLDRLFNPPGKPLKFLSP